MGLGTILIFSAITLMIVGVLVGMTGHRLQEPEKTKRYKNGKVIILVGLGFLMWFVIRSLIILS